MRKKLMCYMLSLAISFSVFNLNCFATPQPNFDQLTNEQKDAITLANYLIVLSQEIDKANDSRLVLDNIYLDIVNNINPELNNGSNKDRIDDMIDTMEEYYLNANEREKMQYLYNQNKAIEISKIIPDPLWMLNVNTSDLVTFIPTVVFMTRDAIKSYNNEKDSRESEYLKKKWELDENAKRAIRRNMQKNLQYASEIVEDYQLKENGMLTLTAETVDDFVDMENDDDLLSKIKKLEDNKSTYKAFGRYWIVLAKSYCENKEYLKCISAIDEYEKLAINVFRYNFELARVLPCAVASLEKIKPINYTKMKHYCDLIEQNTRDTNSKDWELKYFVLLTYIKMYEGTKNRTYLEHAFDIAKKNINMMKKDQINQNEIYLTEEIKKKMIETEKEKREREENNEKIEDRKNELPPVYEPLVLNYEMVLKLAEFLNTSDEEKQKIDNLMYGSNAKMFLNEIIDNYYKFNKNTQIVEDIEFDKGNMIIPAKYVTVDSNITVSITSDSESEENYYYWDLEEVKTDKANKANKANKVAKRDINKIKVKYSSKAAKKHKYSEKDIIMIDIQVDKNKKYGILQYEIQPIKKGPFRYEYKINNKKYVREDNIDE